MKILVLATKSPYPANDGGRLVLWLTLQALANAGHQIKLIAPVFEHEWGGINQSANLALLQTVCEPHFIGVRRNSWFASLPKAIWHGRALTNQRHHFTAITNAVRTILRDWQPELVHVEQIQALSHAAPAVAKKIPIILRMQNVESDLWQQVAALKPLAFALRLEARRLRRDESKAIEYVHQTLALTQADADLLNAAHGARTVQTIAPCFPTLLPNSPALEGEPALVLSGSDAWWPNQHSTQDFLARCAADLYQNFPAMRIHIFGGKHVARNGVVLHPSPLESIDTFPSNAILLIPLKVGSGIRMRILEAFARGMPVIASDVAVKGLHVNHGQQLLIANSASEIQHAVMQLHTQKALRHQLIDAGRAYLKTHHDPQTQIDKLIASYTRVCSK